MIFESLFGTRDKPLEPCKTSPGKLRAYQQCPYKYKLIHVDGCKIDSAPSPHLAFDAILNSMVESFQRKSLSGHLEPSNEILMSELEKAWKPDHFTEPDELREFYDAARSAALNMARWFAESTGRILPCQNKPAIGIFAAWYPKPLTIWTRLDRVERLPDGSIRLIDFKSGGREITAAEMRMDLGIRIQAMAGKEMFGNDLSRFALVYMRTGNTIEVSCDDLDLDLIQADVKTIVSNIQANRFDPNLGPLCSVCDFQPDCRGWRKKLPWETAGETRDIYCQRLRLSYSKMSLFERCPRAYHALYHQRIAPKPQPFFSFGSCIHAVMEIFYDPASRERPNLDRMLNLLDEKWRFFRAGYRSDDEEARYFDQARNMLTTYFNHFILKQPFRPASFIEKYFEIPVGDAAVMTGFIDRIDMVPKQGAIVLDYKTEPTDRTQEAVDKDLQLTLYYWATREFLDLDVRQLGLYMMSHDKLVMTTRTPEDIPGLLDRINDVTTRILNETEFPPKINKYCLSCDHLSECPLKISIQADQSLRSMEFNDEDSIVEYPGDDG
ncbi:PD-(D/E)XK nuclease family protein [bacterium]|nr:PD-(D/E)XK nuclease family protein [candidate division CSSED10-310 bacterium]